MRKEYFILIVLFSFLLSCQSHSEGYFISSNLPGMIYDSENRPCSKVDLVVSSVDEDGSLSEIERVQSDINGRFTISGLSRGSYRIICTRQGYESIESDIFYSSRLEVLYLKIMSQRQILNSAEVSLSERHFGLVEKYLLRSEKINNDAPYHLYMKSVFYYEKDMFTEAIEPLKRIEELRYKFPYVHLMLADIYQYKLKDRRSAGLQLERYLKLMDDSDIKIRREELEKDEI